MSFIGEFQLPPRNFRDGSQKSTVIFDVVHRIFGKLFIIGPFETPTPWFESSWDPHWGNFEPPYNTGRYVSVFVKNKNSYSWIVDVGCTWQVAQRMVHNWTSCSGMNLLFLAPPQDPLWKSESSFFCFQYRTQVEDFWKTCAVSEILWVDVYSAAIFLKWHVWCFQYFVKDPWRRMLRRRSDFGIVRKDEFGAKINSKLLVAVDNALFFVWNNTN